MINYHLLSYAQKFYENLGYVNVEVPWIIEHKYIEVTLPKGKRPFMLSNKYSLCGSAEQGFIHAMNNHIFEDYKLQAITPCFRDEVEETEITKSYFMKLELIHINPLVESYEELITDALSFFESLGLPVKRIKTEEGEDLFFRDVELGSYGIRSYANNTWIYGTGCPEPRTSFCLREHLCE